MKMNLEYFRYFLSGLLILGLISAGSAKPQPTDDYLNDDDYHYDDENLPTSGQDKSTVSSLRSTVSPSFVSNDYTKTYKPGEDANLECAARNVAESNVILWYKEKMIVTQGTEVVNKRYQFEPTNHTLIIPKALEADSGDYFCSIFPQNMTLHAKLLVTNESDSEYNTAAARSSSGVLRVSHLLYGALLSLVSIGCLEKFLRI